MVNILLDFLHSFLFPPADPSIFLWEIIASWNRFSSYQAYTLTEIFYLDD